MHPIRLAEQILIDLRPLGPEREEFRNAVEDLVFMIVRILDPIPPVEPPTRRRPRAPQSSASRARLRPGAG